jgi:hypothetical protein
MARLTEAPAPAVAAICERLLGRADRLATDLTGVIQRAEPFYATGDVVSRDDLRASVRNNLVHILSSLAGHLTPGLEPPRNTGRRRAEQGAPLAAILHAYRVAGQYIWAAILAEAATDGVTATALLPAAADLWLIIDEHSGSVTDSYRDTVVERTRRDEQTRNAMLDVLLRGDLGDGSRLWESAAALRLPHQGTFVVVAAQPARPAQPGGESIPRAEDALRVRGVQSAWRVEVDAHVGVVVLNRRIGVERLGELLGELTTGPVGVSQVYAHLDQTPTALRQARLACAAAAPRGHHLIRYEEVPVAVLLASAPDAATAVARAVLGPVLDLPEAECDVLLDTLGMWFAEQGATSAAAARLHVHRNTVRYRLRRLEELTGRGLAQPTGLAELYLALEATRILNLRPIPPRGN